MIIALILCIIWLSIREIKMILPPPKPKEPYVLYSDGGWNKDKTYYSSSTTYSNGICVTIERKYDPKTHELIYENVYEVDITKPII